MQSKYIDKYYNKYKKCYKIQRTKLKKAISKANELIEQMSESERQKYVPGFNIYEQENISDTFYSDNNVSSDIFSEQNAIYEDSSNFLIKENEKYCDNEIINEEKFSHYIIDFFEFLGNYKNKSYLVQKEKSNLIKIFSFLLQGKMDINRQKGNKIINIIKNSNSKEENDILNEYLNIALDNIKNGKI